MLTDAARHEHVHLSLSFAATRLGQSSSLAQARKHQSPDHLEASSFRISLSSMVFLSSFMTACHCFGTRYPGHRTSCPAKTTARERRHPCDLQHNIQPGGLGCAPHALNTRSQTQPDPLLWQRYVSSCSSRLGWWSLGGRRCAA